MALDTGTIYTRLELDDSRFVAGIQRAETSARGLSTQLDRAGSGAADSMHNAARQVGAVGDAASDASTQVRGLDRVPAGLGQSADRAERSVRAIGTGARDASNGLRRIDADALTRITRGAEDAGDALRGLDRWQLDALIREANRAGSSIGEEIRQGASHAERALGRLDGEGLSRVIQQAQAARRELGQVGDAADDATSDLADTGGDSGSDAGGNFLSGFSDAISGMSSKAGPIAGSILGVAALGLGVGVALAAAIKDGMQQELDRDMFQAQTGTTTAQASKFGQAAGEAYADNFGESIAGNLEVARSALGNGLLDPGATQRDAEAVIGSLSSVATLLGDDIPNVARAAGNAVKSGFATDVNDAMDLLVKGQQMGLNSSEDLVDTVTEYSVQFAKVGLSGAEAFGLMGQAVQGGARDTDTAADAIKEFAIRSVDGSKAAAEAYEALGLNAGDMSAKIARGGEEGTAGMEELLTKIRETEDPLVRNAVAVGLFGTKAEDLGDAMYNLDLTTATQSMNDYEGAAKTAIQVMNGNAASSVEGAMRSISTVADGLKAALAEAFGPQIQEWASAVSNNRAGVIDFFMGIGNAGFDAAEAVAAFVADGMRMLGEFAGAAAETGASFLDMAANILSVGESIPGFGALLGIATDGAADKLRGLADSTRNGGAAIEDTLGKGAAVIDDTLIPGIQRGQDKFNEFAGNMKLSAAFNDEIQKVNDSISNLGVQADGSLLQIDNFTGSLNNAVPAQAALDGQLRSLAAGFEAQTRTGLEAGATVEELTGQYGANRDALITQAMQMGLTNGQAVALADSYGLVPDLVDTQINQPGMPEAHLALDILKGKVVDVPDGKTIVTEALTKDAVDALSALGLKVETLPDGTTRITANTDEGQIAIDNFLNANNNKKLSMFVELQQRRIGYWESLGASATDAPRMQGPVPIGDFADGGAIRGAGGPRDDLVPLWGSNGEHMLDAGDVSKLGGQAGVYRFRAALDRGDVGAYADGGAIGNKEAAISFAQSKNGMAYEYGKLDCSGYWSGIYNAYTGKDVRFTTDSDFAALGFEQGYDPGGFNIGTNGGSGENGHMAGDLFGTPAESSSSGIAYGAGAQSAQDFPMVWHLPRGDDGNEQLGLSADGSSGSGSSTAGGAGSGSGAPGGDVRSVYVTNWPSSMGGSSTGSGSGSRSSGSGGGSPQSGGAAGGLLKTIETGLSDLAPTPDAPTEYTAENDPNGMRALREGGDFTDRFREAFSVEEDSKLVDAILRERDGGTVGGQFDAENDPDGLKAIAAGEFTDRFREKFGVEEDSDVAKAILEGGKSGAFDLVKQLLPDIAGDADPDGMKALLENGDFTSKFRDAFGAEEDSAVVNALLESRDAAKVQADAAVESAKKVSAAVDSASSPTSSTSPVAPSVPSTPSVPAGAGVSDVRVVNWPFGIGDGAALPGQASGSAPSGGGSGMGILQAAADGIAQAGAFAASPALPALLGQPIAPGDTVPAMLQPGEMVIPKDIVDQHGGLLEMIRNNAVGSYAEGGTVGFFGPSDRSYESGGSKHAESVHSWAAAQSDSDAVGSGKPLTVLRNASKEDVANENMYRGIVGAVGAASFISEQIESILGGGVLGLAKDSIEAIVEGIGEKITQMPVGDIIDTQIQGDVVQGGGGKDSSSVVAEAFKRFSLY